MADHWDVVATLTDGSRRALYDYIRRQDHVVSREEAADATGMSRGLAAFHLDKLVEAGLLAARYEAPADQPRGRGRAPKVYEVTGDGLAVSIPERRYELLAEILADAVADDPTRAGEAARCLAQRRGRHIGAHMRQGGAGVLDVLASLGFEPQAGAGGRIRLHNCPFRAVVERQTALICGLNLSLVAGLLDGLNACDVEAILAPRPGACCVELTTEPRSPANSRRVG